MVPGKARISLNEVSFGAAVFAGSIALLRNCVGDRNTERILLTGAMFTAEEALSMNLIDRISSEENLAADAMQAARNYAANYGAAYRCVKKLLRDKSLPQFGDPEKASIDEFLKIWYSEDTMKNLEKIKIRA